MEAGEYRALFGMEDSHWWYVGLHELVLAWGRRLAAERGEPLRILDAGCGTGGLSARLSLGETFSFDRAAEAMPFLSRRGLRRCVRASVSEIPFASGAFDLVVSLDVLCHAAVRDVRAALLETSRVLKPGGVIILNLPAYESMRSRHDLAVHNVRRYRRGDLREALQAAGFRPRVLTYRNTLLFPVAAAVRCLQRLRGTPPGRPESDLRPLPALVNRALAAVLRLENWLVLRGASLPFGLSVFAIGEKCA